MMPAHYNNSRCLNLHHLSKSAAADDAMLPFSSSGKSSLTVSSLGLKTISAAVIAFSSLTLGFLYRGRFSFPERCALLRFPVRCALFPMSVIFSCFCAVVGETRSSPWSLKEVAEKKFSEHVGGSAKTAR